MHSGFGAARNGRRSQPNGAAPDNGHTNGHAYGGSRPVRVLVADNHSGFRSSVVRALDVIPDVEVAGEAESADKACEAVVTLEPDVVLMDLSMPGMDALDATRRIRRSHPATRVVVLTAFDGPSTEQSALAAGASGIVTKGSPLEDVVGVILHAADDPPSR